MEKQRLVRQGMCIAVMGFGVTGRSAIRFCLAQGARVLVSDSGDKERLETEYGRFFQEHGILYEAGGHTIDFLEQADLVIVSPGISLDLPIMGELERAGVQIAGELAVAAPMLDQPVVAVTGTNGKTTVTALLGHLLQQAGRQPFIGGNIGTPLLDNLCEPGNYDCMVLEVSSFQLEKAGTFAPKIGVLLNITPDHLDRHGSLAAYAEAKRHLFSNGNSRDTAVVNGDDELCRDMAMGLGQKVLLFGRGAGNDAQLLERSVRVGDDVYELAETELAGWIGAANAAAAILAARTLGISKAEIAAGLKSFQKQPHRLQKIATIKGVTFINDSKATNTGAVVAALSQFEGGVYLIAGGRHKGEDYAVMRQAIRDRVSGLVLIGEAADSLAAALDGCCPIDRAATMEEAVRLAWSAASSGDTVLLSPACASFDMFTSYGHRGEVFVEAVQALADGECMSENRGRNG